MSPLRLLVFLGSTREGRQGEKIANYVVKCLQQRSHDVELIDPLKLGSDGHVHQPLHFRRDQSSAPDWMVATNAKIKEANAFVIVTPEYNCALPPALTSTMNQYPPDSYRHKPCAIVCYSMGQFGGVRAAAFARPFLSELGMISTPSVCAIPQVQGKFSDEECTDERIKKNLDKLLDEIQWYGAAISQKIKADGIP
nr:uncharacterized protein LOC123756862 [Procambarus clarkii]